MEIEDIYDIIEENGEFKVFKNNSFVEKFSLLGAAKSFVEKEKNKDKEENKKSIKSKFRKKSELER
ncbi:hypothetical protein EII29_10130 [Leptotrichia sp. OH3620_COT-345]|uniref:hypothetical protein n=1 Tax=Leptotrichia sp. OH3620_COT-345 TaxID=2491048 RepID=UPI000F6489FF|nr:hypothetical protein [Leptotrichia sp. OH3620_COT-345]RRD38455.1 hypothetical protein EII29_10130 [Leptotrichia sp. OH3620_COT-345]